MRRRCFGLAAAIFLGSSSAVAQPREASPPPSNPPSIADAQIRFRRALELHEEGNLDAARTELRRAYETAPNYKVLFNLAQVEFELLDYPAALTTFEKYLNEGGDRIPKERRAQVQSDIEKLRGRLGNLEIAVNVAGARVTVDDVPVGTTPLLHPVLVSAGRRRIAVSRPGFVTETRVIDVAGGDHSATSFELTDAGRQAPAVQAAPPVASEAVAPVSARHLEELAPAPEKATRSVPWVGWVATALLAGGAGITGGLALQRSQQLSDERARYPVERAELDRLQKEAATFAMASDICAGTAAFAGLVSLYLTLSSGGEQKKEQARAVRVSPSLGFVSVEGSF